MSTSKSTGICRLCAEARELQRSHILPAAAHRNTKEIGKNVRSNIPQGTINYNNQKDFVEKLLCFDCEQLISVFEGKAIEACKEAWRDSKGGYYIIPSVAVAPLLQFAYSVFWRASVSTSISQFKLPPSSEIELKEYFLSGTAAKPPHLALSLSFFRLPLGLSTSRILMTPWEFQFIAGLTQYYFCVFGIVFRLHFPSALHECERDEFLRSPPGSGCIYPLKEWELVSLGRMLDLAVSLGKSQNAT